MKKSEFVSKVMNHKSNTLFVNEDQVLRAVEIFEDLGINEWETEDDAE